MPEPLVTVIIPLYNASNYIAQCIDSVLAQTWSNIEVIVVDDGSTDNSLQIAGQYKSDKVFIVTQENSGASIARNKGLKLAKGDYIQFLDADDILSENKIASQMNILNNSRDHVGLCNTVHFKDGEDFHKAPIVNEWFATGSDDPVDFLLKLYAGNEVMPGYGGMVQPNAWLTPKNLIDKAGPWKKYKCPDDDGEFFCRIILESKGIRFSREGINYYRKFDNNKSLSSQRTREATENIYQTIDLKYKYLKERTDSKILDRILARHYWELGVAAYPKHPDISAKAIKKAKFLGYKGPKYLSGEITNLISDILGWRIARLITYYRYKF
ncbi:MAG TPA: glycosyltransferase [Mucilaginibacter sp.]|nr:glycosyltransferase [Mucilaginibacter sp.]